MRNPCLSPCLAENRSVPLSLWLFPNVRSGVGGRADPAGADRGTAVFDERRHCAFITFDDPVVDIADAQILRIINVKIRCLPHVVCIGLSLAGNFHI